SELEHSSDSCDEYDSANAEFIRKKQVPVGVDCWYEEDEEPPDAEITIRYLVDANGKLIMVRRQLQFHVPGPKHTGKVEVFEADTGAGAWVPVDGGGLGGGGQALFISQRFKCYGQGNLDEDAIDFVDTGEAFGMRSGAIRPALWCLEFCSPTWVFTPDL
uniref:KIB1-4 beta-propeller domain-containing protein n=1 Tax=Setaria italica TaxID=4555 RepID=K4A3G4_SETIT